MTIKARNSTKFYKVRPSFEGQGYACEAITAITNFVNYRSRNSKSYQDK